MPRGIYIDEDALAVHCDLDVEAVLPEIVLCHEINIYTRGIFFLRKGLLKKNQQPPQQQ